MGDKPWIAWALFLLLGTALGFALQWIGGPMPFMFGGILGAGTVVTVLDRRFGERDRRIPSQVRMTFVALAGAMIGATFSPSLLAVLPAFWSTALAILVFVVVAHGVSFAVILRVGGYPRVDAFYAAMPGGLIEASILGEKAGADPKALAVQHFIRVLIVVMVVPLVFLALTGQTVGSAAGQGIVSDHDFGWSDLAWLVGLAGAGLVLARRAHLPAAHLMGPLALVALAQSLDISHIAVPHWLIALAQLVIGIGLGSQMSGLDGAQLARGFRTGIASVAAMFVITLIFAVFLVSFVPAPFSVVVLAFAPGGVTEMSLIALSLQASPVIVALHHMIRIMATVLLTGWVGAWLEPWLKAKPGAAG